MPDGLAIFSISDNANTRLPGYMDSTQHFGQDFKSMAPGFDFILGKQPDSNWLNRKAAQGLITRDTNFDQSSFNILKYDLNFFSPHTKVYRIDNTDWLIIINPKS